MRLKSIYPQRRQRLYPIRMIERICEIAEQEGFGSRYRSRFTDQLVQVRLAWNEAITDYYATR